MPAPVSARFPIIRASLDDGFFSLAEQQARGVLRENPSEEESKEALLLLTHALWGQKRYSEMLDLLEGRENQPGLVYWRVRAHYELRQYEQALEELAAADGEKDVSRFAPSLLRLQGHIEQKTADLKAAESTFRSFAETYPTHRERIENEFDLAKIYTLQKRIPEAIASYESLLKEENNLAVQRAQLKLSHVLYTQGAAENFDRARNLLDSLGANENNRLSYRIDAYVDLGALEERAGRKKESFEAMRKAVALSPDAQQRVPLKLALARMLLRGDDTSGALRLLEEGLVEAPNAITAAELQLTKAGALLQAKRYQTAVDAYQVYLDVADDPSGLAQAYFGKGLGLWEMERYTESAVVLDKAVDALRDPAQRADALFKAGDAYYKADKIEEAEKRYRAFIDEFSYSDRMPNALYQLGLSLAKIGRRTEAMAMFEMLESNYGSSPFADQAALRYADVMLASEQWEKALAKYQQIKDQYAESPAAAISLHQSGLVMYQLGRLEDALQAFETVVNEFPDNEYAPQAFYMRGFCLYLQGQVDEAVQTCRTFIEQYPDSEWTPDVIFWLAERNYNTGNYKEAEPLFLRIASDFKGHRLAPRALYWAGRCAAAMSNYVKAIEQYAEVAKNYPTSEIMPQTRFSQGDALSELGEFSRAILAFEEIIKNYPDNYLVNAAWGRKGDCQFSLAVDNPNRYTEAIGSYQAILDRPSAPLALKLQAEYKIGRCHEKSNQPDKAFSRYMNVVYTFMNENVERSTYSVMWFTRSAFGAATLKEKEKAWIDAAQIYDRVVEANVPAGGEAAKRIAQLKKDNWLLFQQAEETDNVGIDG